MLELLPKFLSWLISFIIVCKFWLNHHHILALAHHANYAMVWLKAIFLMFQSFVPFPTALMGEYATNPLAVSMFGVVMAVNTVLFIALHAYILHHCLVQCARRVPGLSPYPPYSLSSRLQGETLPSASQQGARNEAARP